VGHNKILSGELHISFRVKLYSSILIYYPKGALLKYHKFDYKLQK